MNESLFNENSNPPSVLADLVGENKKFKDIEALAKGKQESDAYIKTLEQKADELAADLKAARTEINTGRSVQEMLDQLAVQQSQRSYENQPQLPDANTRQSAFDPKQVKDLATEQYFELKAQEQQQQNLKTVMDKLTEHFGNEYESVLNKQMDELGLSAAEVNRLAKTSPKALMRTLGIDGPRQREDFQSPPRTTQRGFAPQGQEKRTWNYYQKIRKENPDLYYSPKLTAQRHADAISMGDSFKDGTWQD